MLTELKKALKDFQKLTPGKPFAIRVAGGGAHIALACASPGSTKRISSYSILQGTEVDQLLEKHVSNTRSAASADGAILCMHSCSSTGVIPVGVSAALTTDRPRKGENRAYIAMPSRTLKISLRKIYDERDFNIERATRLRLGDDQIVSTAALLMMMGDRDLKPVRNLLTEDERLEWIIQ